MDTTVTLDAEASLGAIEASVRTQSPLVLELPAFPRMTINGSLVAGDGKALLMVVSGRPDVDLDRLAGEPCEVKIHGNHGYCYSATILSSLSWGESRCIAIQRPEILNVVDRRRFLRAKLAPSSQVTLRWKSGGTTHSHTVTLLNISSDGVACRLDDAIASGIEKRDELDVSFELPARQKPFEFKARVTNKTPASEGSTILGVQFLVTPPQQCDIAELRIAIEGRLPTASGTEVCV